MATSGGENKQTVSSALSAATDNAGVIKAAPGVVFALHVGTIAAAARYLRLYDKASAPVPATDTPVARFIVPSNGATGAGNNMPMPKDGLTFKNGIAMDLTAGIADTDTTATAAADSLWTIIYE